MTSRATRSKNGYSFMFPQHVFIRTFGLSNLKKTFSLNTIKLFQKYSKDALLNLKFILNPKKLIKFSF